MKHTSITRFLPHAIAAAIAIVTTSPLSAQTLAISEDFNGDGVPDMAVVTAPTTITVSLTTPFGFVVSAILSTPNNHQISAIGAYDHNGDGVLDIGATSPAGSTSWYSYVWFGNGDGTFGNVTTRKYSWPKGRRGFF